MNRRKSLRIPDLQIIFDKTKGHCHFCGDKLVFERRGKKPWPPLEGQWEVDHIKQIDKLGQDTIENKLPIHSECNRARWNRNGNDVRYLISIGLIARDEIDKKSEIGLQLLDLFNKKEKHKKSRRKKS